MRKAYVIKDLEGILGCSRTAIVKKIKINPEKPGTERYKDRFEVVLIDGKKAIMLSDEELELEKMLSRGVKNVSTQGDNIGEMDDFIDIEPEKEKNTTSEVISFTERYISEFKTFQETAYNEMRNLASERDTYKNQILLLEDSEKRKESALMETIAENVTLKKHRTMLTVALSVITLVLVCFITFYVTYITLHNTIIKPDENVMQKKEQVIQEVQPKVEQPAQPANKKRTSQRKN